MFNPDFPTQAREIIRNRAIKGVPEVEPDVTALTRLHYQELEAVLEGLKKLQHDPQRCHTHCSHAVDQALAEVRREMEAK